MMKKLLLLFVVVVLLGCPGWLWLARAKVPETWQTLGIGDSIDAARAKVPELHVCRKDGGRGQWFHAGCHCWLVQQCGGG